jgi:hypothetical protein
MPIYSHKHSYRNTKSPQPNKTYKIKQIYTKTNTKVE